MENIKCLVVGSGFGGAVASYRLGLAGHETIVLERGRRWDIEDNTINQTFGTFTEMDGRCEWLNDTGITKTPALSLIHISEPTRPY